MRNLDIGHSGDHDEASLYICEAGRILACDLQTPDVVTDTTPYD